MINLPVALLLKTDGQERWVALLKVEGDRYHIQDDSGSRIFTRNELLVDYLEKAHYIWRDPNPGQGLLRAFSEGDAVQEVQDLLHGLGILEVPANGAYDGRTIEAVTQVQRATGLIPDGIVGYQTRMVLCAWTESVNMPRLQSPVFSAPALERIVDQPGLVITQPTPPQNDDASSEDELKESLPNEVSSEATIGTTELSVIRLTNDSFFEDAALKGEASNTLPPGAESAEPDSENNDSSERYTPVLPEPNWYERRDVTESSDTNIPLVPFEESTVPVGEEGP